MSTHFRLTRPGAYGTGTPGREHVSARQGYYISADSPEQAADLMRQREPDFSCEYFDVQLWDESTNHGKVIARAI